MIMKIRDLVFRDTEANGYSFIKRTLFRDKWETDAETYNKHIKSLIRKAKDTDDFVKLYLADNSLKRESCYAALLRTYRSEKVWYYVREMFGDKCRKTWSDAGSLKVGTDDFSILISNGHGDGEMRYAVLEKEEIYNELYIMCHETTIKGKFNIYSYDCGDDVDMVVEGNFFVYSYEGLVALVRWE